MVKLFVLFPHTGDDGFKYEPGMHREVPEGLVESYLRPVGTLELYSVMVGDTIKKDPPIYAKEVESKGAVLQEAKEPETVEPKSKSKKK